MPLLDTSAFQFVEHETVNAVVPFSHCQVCEPRCSQVDLHYFITELICCGADLHQYVHNKLYAFYELAHKPCDTPRVSFPEYSGKSFDNSSYWPGQTREYNEGPEYEDFSDSGEDMDEGEFFAHHGAVPNIPFAIVNPVPAPPPVLTGPPPPLSVLESVESAMADLAISGENEALKQQFVQRWVHHTLCQGKGGVRQGYPCLIRPMDRYYHGSWYVNALVHPRFATYQPSNTLSLQFSHPVPTAGWTTCRPHECALGGECVSCMYQFHTMRIVSVDEIGMVFQALTTDPNINRLEVVLLPFVDMAGWRSENQGDWMQWHAPAHGIRVNDDAFQAWMSRQLGREHVPLAMLGKSPAIPFPRFPYSGERNLRSVTAPRPAIVELMGPVVYDRDPTHLICMPHKWNGRRINTDVSVRDQDLAICLMDDPRQMSVSAVNVAQMFWEPADLPPLLVSSSDDDELLPNSPDPRPRQRRRQGRNQPDSGLNAPQALQVLGLIVARVTTDTPL